MSLPPGAAAYKISFELSPVILVGGLAGFLPGLPIISLTQSLSFINGVLSGGGDLDPDDFFANFQPLPNSSLIENQYGQYPFANQSVAANAVIVMPLTISLLMICPARGPGGYAVKLATMTMLQTALTQHGAMGGTYIVATPSYIYSNCVLTAMRDVSTGESIQRQFKYQLDFWQPLLTLQQAQAAQNALMQQLTNQTPGSVSWSGSGAPTAAPSNLPGVIPSGSGSVAGVGASPPVTYTSSPLPTLQGPGPAL
jgi:hypothetical protein